MRADAPNRPSSMRWGRRWWSGIDVAAAKDLVLLISPAQEALMRELCVQQYSALDALIQQRRMYEVSMSWRVTPDKKTTVKAEALYVSCESLDKWPEKWDPAVEEADLVYAA